MAGNIKIKVTKIRIRNLVAKTGRQNTLFELNKSYCAFFFFLLGCTTKVPGRRKLVFGDSSTQSMVIPVVEFSSGGYKIGKIFA